MLQETLPLRRKADFLTHTVKQLRAEFFLQKPDLLGHSRLGDVMLLRRLGKALILCRSHKILQLIGIHFLGSPSLIISFTYSIM